MAIQVYLVKRYLRGRQRNGQRKHRWAIRWRDPATGKDRCESTGTADRVQAEGLQKLKWAELNGLAEPSEPEVIEPEAAGVKPAWGDCRDALRRAMEADNLRPTYIGDSLLTLESVRRMFPEVASPADVTSDMANEYKRRRAEGGASPWTVRGDLSTLKAIFGKWLGKECGLLDPSANPFADVKPPRCDDPDVRIVSADESAELFAWIADRWNNWRLPAVYLEVAALLGWRATEIASIREDDLMADGHIRVLAESSKTRRHKYGWLPPELFADVQACSAAGFAFGRFADDLRRLLMLWKKKPHHAAKVGDFAPKRLVGWLQDELQRFNDAEAAKVAKAREEGETVADWLTFTLHDFRRTAITGLQMAGVTEKEASVMVGATPEVMRKHYLKLDEMAIARRNVERRLSADGRPTVPMQNAQSMRAGCARGENRPLDDGANRLQTVGA